jgi:TRAP transporter TAXI family solute receptor
MSPLARTHVTPPQRPNPWFRVLLFSATIAVICAVVLILTYTFFVDPPPPRHLVIAAGSKEGAYYKYAQRYARLLEEKGYQVEVRETRGSGENLQLLQDDRSGVTLAIVQGGVADEAAHANLEALGSLFREPLWVFYRGEKGFDTLSQLAGKRLAIGPPGSGTRAVAEKLLKANSITAANATLLDLTGLEAAAALESGSVDAVFVISAIEAPYVQQLFRAPGVHVLSMARQAAYVRRYPFLSAVTVPAGLVDLGSQLPTHDTLVVAPTAMLVARKDLHPALIPLLLTVMTQVHRDSDLLSTANEFPSPLYTDLPLNEDARHYYQSGPPLLQRFMPFWMATLVDRLKVMVIPIVMLLLPLLRFAPPLVHWRNRRKIYLWYNLLRDIEEKIAAGITIDEVREELAALHNIDVQLPRLSVPLGYMGEFHTMRFHLMLVRAKLDKLLAENNAAAGAAAIPLPETLPAPPSPVPQILAPGARANSARHGHKRKRKHRKS